LQIQCHANRSPVVNRILMIFQPETASGRFRTAMERSRRSPKTSSSGGSESGNVQRCGDTSINVAPPVGCHDLACPSLRRVSKMRYAISGRIQSVSQRFLPDSGRERFAAGMDSLLRVRFSAQPQPVELG
jgi:hypothetical protein